MRRAPAVAALAIVALTCAAPAAAQVEDPPERLWRDFPLTTRTEAPPAVPPARTHSAHAPTGETRESVEPGGGGGVSPWIVGVAAAAAATLLGGAWRAGRHRRPAAPDRAVVSRAERFVTRDVVARAGARRPPGPLYEIVWRDRAERSGFELVALEGDADLPDLPRSRATGWRITGSPPRVSSLRAAHDELCDTLLATGWEPAGTGDAWYATRFRAPAHARVLARSNTRPVQ